jgi:hypothetical protein
MFKGNIALIEWNVEGNEEFAVKLPSTPETNENYFTHEDQHCGHHFMAKGLKRIPNAREYYKFNHMH